MSYFESAKYADDAKKQMTMSNTGIMTEQHLKGRNVITSEDLKGHLTFPRGHNLFFYLHMEAAGAGIARETSQLALY